MTSSEKMAEKEETIENKKILYTVDSVETWPQKSKSNVVVKLSPSPCGKYLAVGTSTTLKVFEVESGSRLSMLNLPVNARTVMWSWRSKHVAVSDDESMILVLTNRLELESSLDTSARLAGFRGETDLLTCDSDSLRRHRMTGTSSHGDTIDLLPWLEEIHCVSCVAMSRKRSRIVIGGRTTYPSKSEEDLEVTSSILVFDVSDRTFIPCHHIHFDTSETITLPLLSATSPRTVSFATRVSKLCRRHVPGSPVVSVSICDDASKIVAVDKKGRVVVWNLNSSSSSMRKFVLVSSSSREAQWWSNDSVLILLSDGGLLLTSVVHQEEYHKNPHTITNRLGNSPEYFAENSSISSRLVNRERMFVLETEKEESTLWSLSRATPRQVLQSKLNDREYVVDFDDRI